MPTKRVKDFRFYCLEKTIKVQYSCMAHNAKEAREKAQEDWEYNPQAPEFEWQERCWKSIFSEEG